MSNLDEFEKYQRAMFALFRSEGWKYLCEELDSLKEDIDKVAVVRDNDDLRFRQGQMNVIARVTNLPYSVEQMERDEETL